MPVNRYFSSIAQPTALSGGVNNTVGFMTVDATTGFPTSYPYTLSVGYGTAGEELVDVTNAAGTTLTVTRGVDGTAAQSHGAGAVVRHVSSARDFADFQTHAAATAAVHGVAGTLVGTSDAQTLANKTLTSPTINGAALSGTLTGTPTFNSSVNFTASPDFRGAAAGTQAIGTRVTGDTTPRLIVGADGRMIWGPGNFTGDVNLSRSGVAALAVDSSLTATRSAVTDLAYAAQVSGDTVARFRLGADGKQQWGPGGAAALDANLYRNAVGELKTDTALTAVGNLSAANFPAGASSAWTPAWSTSSGLHVPSFGNATVSGLYFKVGRQVFFYLAITFGPTTNFGAGATTTDNWTFSLPGGLTAAAVFAGAPVPCGFGYAAQGGSAVCPLQVTVDSGATSFSLSIAGGRLDGAAITNGGIVDSLSPWTWASGNAVRFNGQVEVTS